MPLSLIAIAVVSGRYKKGLIVIPVGKIGPLPYVTTWNWLLSKYYISYTLVFKATTPNVDDIVFEMDNYPFFLQTIYGKWNEWNMLDGRFAEMQDSYSEYEITIAPDMAREDAIEFHWTDMSNRLSMIRNLEAWYKLHDPSWRSPSPMELGEDWEERRRNW